MPWEMLKADVAAQTRRVEFVSLSPAGWRAAESRIKLGLPGTGHLKLHCFTQCVF